MDEFIPGTVRFIKMVWRNLPRCSLAEQLDRARVLVNDKICYGHLTPVEENFIKNVFTRSDEKMNEKSKN